MPKKLKAKQSLKKKSASRSVSTIQPDADDSLREQVKALKRGRVIQAACETFYEYGYQLTTVDMITERLSGTKAIFYYIFKDKNAVLEAIFDRALITAREVIKALDNHSDKPEDILYNVAKGYANWLIENQMMVAVIWREERNLNLEARARMRSMQREIDETIVNLLQRGVDQGVFKVEDIKLTSRALTGMITFTYTWWQNDRRISREEACEHYAKLALKMVGL